MTYLSFIKPKNLEIKDAFQRLQFLVDDTKIISKDTNLI